MPFTRGDWDGFLTLFTDNLAKIIILPTILIGSFHFAPELVFGRILPGLGLAIFLVLVTFAYFSHQLAQREGRADVTALPYGISTPVMFVYLFAIMGPLYFATRDATLAYRVGLGAAFIGGLVEMSGALVGPFITRITPRTGLLGTIAGVALVWIALVPSTIIFMNPLIGLPTLFLVLLGLLGRYQFPFRLPAGLVAIGLGVFLGLLTGDSVISFQDSAFHLPVPVLGDLWIGLQIIFSTPEILAVVIPIEVYNLIEMMGNVETAKTGGDRYNLRHCQVVAGLGTCLGALFGSPFPCTVYLGHPAYKQMGARAGYALATGAVLFLGSLLGFFAFLQQLIPAAALAPLLVFVGIVMTQYAFRETPAVHGVAVTIALLPHMADLLKKQLDGTLLEVLTPATDMSGLVSQLATNQGVYLESYELLSNGAILIGLLWGSIVVFLIDGNLRRAALFSLVGFLLSFVGLIHRDQVGLMFTPITMAYLISSTLFTLVYLMEQVRARSRVGLPVVLAEEIPDVTVEAV